jgi:hypothetical protein
VITYGEAKSFLSKYAGTAGLCATASGVDLFVKQVLDYLLTSGQHGSLRTFCFTAVKGCITLPYELEVPLKVKIEGEVGTVQDRWFTYANKGMLEECIPATEALREEVGNFPTVYDLPSAGAYVGVYGTACEDADAHVIVLGKDPSGHEIYTNHKGTQIAGEYLTVKIGEIKHTQALFGEITGIVKSRTNGYVQLVWVYPSTGQKGYLADYSPLEEKPAYRRFRITSKYCSGTAVKVTILGRIRLKEKYADNDILPFDNLYTLSLAAQTIQAQSNNDVEVADAKDRKLVDIIDRENKYKKINAGKPIVDVFLPTSGGSIKNLVG